MNSFIGLFAYLNFGGLILVALIIILAFVLLKQYQKLCSVSGMAVNEAIVKVSRGTIVVSCCIFIVVFILKIFAASYTYVLNYGAMKEVEGAAKVVVREISSPTINKQLATKQNEPASEPAVNPVVDPELFKFCLDAAKGKSNTQLEPEVITACREASVTK